MSSRFSKKKATIGGLSALLVVAVAFVASARSDGSKVDVTVTVLGAQVVQANGNGNGNNGNGNGNNGNGNNGNGNAPKGSFNIAGQVQGLYPGAVMALPLTLSNPHSFGIQINQLTVTVQSATPPSPPLPGVDLTPACAARDVEVGVVVDGQFTILNPMPVSVTLGKDGSTSLPSKVWLHMGASPPDACQGATFALSYGGSAVKS